MLAAMELPKWNPGLKESDFVYEGNLKKDLTSFARTYMKKVTPQMVKISIGLRAAELEGIATPGIMKVPLVFKNVLVFLFYLTPNYYIPYMNLLKQQVLLVFLILMKS